MPTPKQVVAPVAVPAPPMAGKSPPVAAFDPWGDAKMNVLIYGKHKTGKGTLVGTWPGRGVWFICSGSETAGELRSIATPENKRRITPKMINSSEDFEREVVAAKDENYDFAVLDHLTGFYTLLLSEVVGVELGSLKTGWGDIDVARYDTANRATMRALTKFLSLRCNTIVIAHEKDLRSKDDTKKKTKIADLADSDVMFSAAGPAVTGGVYTYITGAVDFYGHTFRREKLVEETKAVPGTTKTAVVKRKDGTEYGLHVRDHPVYDCGFRTYRRDVPEEIIDPTYEAIVAMLNPRECTT